MVISEIFGSISGESTRAGYLATFIRTFGCNLRCRWCDTMYAVDPKPEDCGKITTMDVPQIMERVEQLGNKHVILTGGEPLLQHGIQSLVHALAGAGHTVEIETNGAVNLAEAIPCPPEDVAVTMDWKCPSSGMTDRMIKSNLELLSVRDVIKFVVEDKNDLDEMSRILPLTQAQAFVSPVFGKIKLPDIVDYMKEHNLQNVRFQLQLHKFIWPVDKRGV